MSLIRTPVLVGVIMFGTSLCFAPAASATIHPLVESFDCANDQAFANHPLGDVAEPPGVTPSADLQHSVNSNLASVRATGPTSPSWSDFKLNGVCGHVGDAED